MEELPPEICSEIMEHLNISDLKSLTEVWTDIGTENRLNPVMHLASTFNYPVMLLASMADTGCVISGSRALEYFNPGSIDDNSDWDFYVPGSYDTTVKMMDALRICGVKWKTTWDDVISLAENEDVQKLTLPLGKLIALDSVKRLYSHWNLPELDTSDDSSRTVADVIEATIDTALKSLSEKFKRVYPSLSHCPLQTGTVTVQKKEQVPILQLEVDLALEQEPTDNCSYEKWETFSVIRGVVQKKAGKETQVQLMVMHGHSCTLCLKTPLELITDFYASHVQCFISGWCAVQLFPEWTEAKKATRWDTDWGKSADMAVEKYKKRGYTCVSPPPVSFPSVRSSTQENGGAIVVAFKPLYVEPPPERRYPQELARKGADRLRAGLNMLSWYVSKYGKLEMNIDKELREIRYLTGAPTGNFVSFLDLVYMAKIASLPEEQPRGFDTPWGKNMVNKLVISGAIPVLGQFINNSELL